MWEALRCWACNSWPITSPPVTFKRKWKRKEKGGPKGYDFVNCTFGMPLNYVRPCAPSSSFLTQNLGSLAKAATFNGFWDSFLTHSCCHSLATKSMGVLMWPTLFQTVWSLSCCHVGALKCSHWGWWHTDPMPPIECWQRWAQNMLPFLPIASGDAMATRRRKSGPPRHSTHALASIVKRLKSSPSVFFSAEITESFNVEPPSLHLLLFFSALFPLVPPH